jgi:outer membrane protein assembly factor BamE (lipoprotein component of BamABCDE complex)
LQRYRLVGMSRAQIVKLLGEADPGNPTDSESFYYLGPERSVLSIDNEWLKIKFHDEVVTSAEDYTD